MAEDPNSRQYLSGTHNVQAASGSTVHYTVNEAPHARFSSLHQLRPPSSDFVGRESEIVSLTQGINQEISTHTIASIRCIRGLGGMGKTELAYAVAQKLASSCSDAQLLIKLRGSTANAMTPEEALGKVISEFDPLVRLPDDLDSLQSQYTSLLHGKRVLILADDAKDAAQVEPLMPPAGCVLLITSRRLFRLPGMPPPLELKKLKEDEAIALVQKVCPSNDFATDQLHQLVNLCGALPLALRISATVLEYFPGSTTQYLSELADEHNRLKNLRGDNSDLGVEASFNLSFATLEKPAQVLLCQLGIFPSTFDRVAVENVVVLPDGKQDSTLLSNLLNQLYLNSLLERDAKFDRFSLHDLVRVFALHQWQRLDLGNLLTEETIRERHARYYLDLIERARELLGTEQEPIILTSLDADRPNFLAAQTFLADPSSSERCYMLSRFQNALQRYYDRRGLWKDGSMMLERAIHVLRASDIDRAELGKLEIHLAEQLRRQYGDHDSALEYGLSGLKHLYVNNSSLDASAGIHYRHIGDIYRARGEFTEALKYYEVAEKLLVGDQYDSERGKLLSSMPEAYLYARLDMQSALRTAQESLALQRRVKDTYEIVQSSRILADVYISLGMAQSAMEHAHEACFLFKSMRGQEDNPLLGWILRTQGEAYRLQGDSEKALDCYNQALHLFSQRDIKAGVAIILEKIGLLKMQIGNHASAISYLNRAVNVAREIKGGKRTIAEILLARVEVGLISESLEDYKIYLTELTEMVSDPDLTVIDAQLVYLLKRSKIMVGVATSVSAGENFNPLDSLTYVTQHNFKLLQVFIDQKILTDQPLRQELIGSAHEKGVELICHAPGLLNREPSLNSIVIEVMKDVLRNNPNKWVVYHFDELQPIDETLDIVKMIVAAGLVPCIENYHRLKVPEKARQHYQQYIDLFSRVKSAGLNVYAVIDIPRVYEAELGLLEEECTNIIIEVFFSLNRLGIPILLHLVDSKSFDLHRNNWCAVGEGAIPYNLVLTRLFASTNQVDAVIFEFEDKHNSLNSRSFLYHCLRTGMLIHHPALAVQSP